MESLIASLVFCGCVALPSTAVYEFRRGNKTRGWWFVTASVLFIPTIVLIGTALDSAQP